MSEQLVSNISVGVDPGINSGCIAWIAEFTSGTIQYHAEPIGKMTEREIADYFMMLKSYVDGGGTIGAVIERVWSMPKQGISSAFKFGQNYGMLRMGLICARIPFEDFPPTKWLKYYGMKKEKDESKTEWKRRLRQKSEQLFPDVKMTNNKADSLLIANYARSISTDSYTNKK